MSNQIAEHTIKGHDVIEVENGCLDFIPGGAVFVRKRELYSSALCSCKDWATTNLLTIQVWEFARGKAVASCFSSLTT